MTPGQNTGPSPDSMPHIQGKNCVLDDSEEVDLPDESEFTRNVSRGNLKSPPLNLYDYSQYYYAYFKSRKEKCCSKIYLKAFQMIYEYTGYSFDNIQGIAGKKRN